MEDTMKHATLIWETLITDLYKQEIIPELGYENWFKPSVATAMDSKSLTIAASDDFSMKWMRDNYKDVLEEHLEKITGQPLKLFFSVSSPEDIPLDPQLAPLFKQTSDEQYYNDDQQNIKTYRQQPMSVQQNNSQVASNQNDGNLNTTNTSSTFNQRIRKANLNPNLSFDNFVSGSSNQLAFSIAQAIAESPGETPYNPMFLYGGSGLGKTHLIQAIGIDILQRFPDKKVLYVTSETFLSEYVSALREKNFDPFNKKYREVDVLIIDDIQFLEDKDKIQEEFFHTFNTLHSMNKQIIMTSDSKPDDLTTLTPRLKTRFNSGFLTDIQPPELETRMAILQKKVSLFTSYSDDDYVPENVIEYIASNIDTNVRDLEGALTSLFARAVSLGEIDITLDLAVDALRSYTNKESQKISIARIQKVVAKYYSIHVDELTSKSRKEPLTTYRHLAVYLCKKLTTNSLKNIGKQFGRRDHTTIMNSIKKVERLQQTDPDTAAVLEELEKQIVVS